MEVSASSFVDGSLLPSVMPLAVDRNRSNSDDPVDCVRLILLAMVPCIKASGGTVLVSLLSFCTVHCRSRSRIGKFPTASGSAGLLDLSFGGLGMLDFPYAERAGIELCVVAHFYRCGTFVSTMHENRFLLNI